MPTKPSPNLSYDDLVAAALLPSDFELPLFVTQLPEPQRTQLLGRVLIPVPHEHPGYEAQRMLFQMMSHKSSDIHLRSWCARVGELSLSALHLLGDMGKPDYVEIPFAVEKGTVSLKDGIRIAALYGHWVDLQQCAGFAALQQRIANLSSIQSETDWDNQLRV